MRKFLAVSIFILKSFQIAAVLDEAVIFTEGSFAEDFSKAFVDSDAILTKSAQAELLKIEEDVSPIDLFFISSKEGESSKFLRESTVDEKYPNNVQIDENANSISAAKEEDQNLDTPEEYQLSEIPKETAVQSEGIDITLSFNKCGTHYFLFMTSFLTLRPIKNISNDRFENFKTDMEYPLDRPFLYQTHIPGDLLGRTLSDDRLIVLVRSPLEILLRSFGIEKSKELLNRLVDREPVNAEKIITIDPYHSSQPIDYALTIVEHLIQIFQCYQDYPSPKKLLVYYEDLISDPIKTMQIVLEFLNEDQKRLPYLAENLEILSQQCQKAYISQFNVDPSLVIRSNGKDPLFFQSQYKVEELEDLRDLISKAFKDISPVYLKY